MIASILPAFVDKQGKPTVGCLTPFCPGWARRMMQYGHNEDCPHGKKILYAIAYEERRGPGMWVPEIEYLHAKDDGEARWEWLNSDMPQVIIERRIVGIAPVIGYHVHDNHGEKLSA